MTTTAGTSGATPARAASRSPSSTPAPTKADAQPQTLAAALAVLQTRLPRIGKDSPGMVRDGKRIMYADLADVSAELLPLLGEVGLSFSAKPTLNAEGKFVLAYRLRHVSGEDDSGEWPLSAGPPPGTGRLNTHPPPDNP